MILSCVSCKCWRRFMKKDITDEEEQHEEGEVYSNPSFDDTTQKANTSVETKRKNKYGSSVVINSPNNSIEPYQEVPDGLVLQNRFADDNKSAQKPLSESHPHNGDLKGAESIDDKSSATDRTSEDGQLYSSGKPDAESNTSTITVSVEVHCTDFENHQNGISQSSSNNCTPKQRSILENHVGNDIESNGMALHINSFAVERLEGNMKKTNAFQNAGMSIAL
ncbi:uncharacterized protein LOC117111313 [Anneissia japonica]|uniref:uncharacterized protein LOC117111313 n=1 Tax=Anneissia japonica TaxID=1529436 RepID=UPI001425AF8B|nr:uncharacterized protein LOC117111313 [Anneissia japonica]XP_033110131.1 uncharacterized protein LOC117111313 [Anneissia japonica]